MKSQRGAHSEREDAATTRNGTGDDMTFAPPREHALRGVVRTLQSTAAFLDLTALGGPT